MRPAPFILSGRGAAYLRPPSITRRTGLRRVARNADAIASLIHTNKMNRFIFPSWRARRASYAVRKIDRPCRGRMQKMAHDLLDGSNFVPRHAFDAGGD